MKVRYTKYETQGATHWRAWKRDIVYKNLILDSIKHFKPEAHETIVDLGCGDGVPTDKLAKMDFKNVTGVEIEKLGIVFAKIHSDEDIEWINSSVEDFTKQEREFDYMYSIDVIEHLDDPQTIVDFMKYVKKFAIVVTDNKDNCKKGNPFHVEELNRDDFKKLFKDFKLEEIPLQDDRFFAFKIISNKK